MALEKLDGIANAQVNNGISLFTTSTKPLDEATIKSALAPFKMKVKSVTKMESLPF